MKDLLNLLNTQKNEIKKNQEEIQEIVEYFKFQETQNLERFEIEKQRLNIDLMKLKIDYS